MSRRDALILFATLFGCAYVATLVVIVWAMRRN